MVETVLTVYPQRFLKEAWVSSQLSHPNIVPFLGVYSSPSHPFGLIYAMMDNLDLGRYLTDHPDVSRLKLVSKRGLYDIGPKSLTNVSLSTPIARRYLACIEIYARIGCHPRKRQDGTSSPPIHQHNVFTRF